MRAAGHIIAHAGLDPHDTAPMTAPRLSEIENWPLPTNRRCPTPKLGRDDNRLWSTFGPTNVAIHTLTAALALDDPTEAVSVGSRIGARPLPAPLVGRRARLHVNLADGHARLGEDAVAAVHVLEVARRAPQMLRVDPTARTVLATLLGRARGTTVSVLRSVAVQAGVAT